jgi:hypothetical protein
MSNVMYVGCILLIVILQYSAVTYHCNSSTNQFSKKDARVVGLKRTVSHNHCIYTVHSQSVARSVLLISGGACVANSWATDELEKTTFARSLRTKHSLMYEFGAYRAASGVGGAGAAAFEVGGVCGAGAAAFEVGGVGGAGAAAFEVGGAIICDGLTAAFEVG